MIQKKTVLILGAGSAPRYFPLGSQLYAEIVASNPFIKGNEIITRIQNEYGIPWQGFEPFRQALERSGKESVDSFLEHRKDFIEVGKKAISAVLIPHEHLSGLFASNSEVKDESKSWYQYLFSKMNSAFDEFGKNNVVFITFNYDRSLEYFLFHSLLNSYLVTEELAASAVKGIPIIHIHGSLGKPHFLDAGGRDYLPSVTPAIIENSAKEIYIVHDDLEARRETQEARRHLREAERVFFLGFGWNEINLNRLEIKKINPNAEFIGGTSLNMTEPEMLNIRNVFRGHGFGFRQYNAGNLMALRESGVLI